MTEDPEPRKIDTRKWRRLLVLIGVFLFLRYIPFIPHAPYCELETFGTRLDKHYKANFTYGLAMFDVPFYSEGERVFLTFGGWLDVDDWVLNAMRKNVSRAGRSAARAHPDSQLGKAQIELDKLKQRIKDFIRYNALARKEGRPEIDHREAFSHDSRIYGPISHDAWMYGPARLECAVMEAVVSPKDN